MDVDIKLVYEHEEFSWMMDVSNYLSFMMDYDDDHDRCIITGMTKRSKYDRFSMEISEYKIAKDLFMELVILNHFSGYSEPIPMIAEQKFKYIKPTKIGGIYCIKV